MTERKPLEIWSWDDGGYMHYAVAPTRERARALFEVTGIFDDEDDEVTLHTTSTYSRLKWLHRAIKADPELLFTEGYVNLAVLDPAPVPPDMLGIWRVTSPDEDTCWVSASTVEEAEDTAALNGGLLDPYKRTATLVPVEEYHTLPWLRAVLLSNDAGLFTPTLLAGV